jgi:NitT/TauT family transport system substrate-binding protein/putative hydroxymethylpyrimidine transport system substrate-binding protein
LAILPRERAARPPEIAAMPLTLPRSLVLAAALLALAIGLAGCARPGEEDVSEAPFEPTAPRDVRLALDFTPNAAHAGIVTASRGRLDRPRGVALRVRPPTNSADSLRTLVSGRADLAVVDIHDLGLARERGEEVIAVAAIVQRPLAAVIARGDVRRPRDLEGRLVGVAGLPSDDAVLRAVVEADRGDAARVRRVTVGFSAVSNLVAGKLDAATAFWNVEGVALRRRGVRTREFRVGDYGAPPYPELVLAATRETLDEDRELIGRAVDAIRAGTESALRDPEPAIRNIARLSESDPALVRAQFEALRPALSPPLVLDPAAIAAWARFDRRFGILRRAEPRAGFDYSFVLPRRR